MSDIIEYKPKEIIMASKEAFDITEEEFNKLDKFIQAKKTGLVKLKSGEYINLSFVSMVKNKNIKVRPVSNIQRIPGVKLVDYDWIESEKKKHREKKRKEALAMMGK